MTTFKLKDRVLRPGKSVAFLGESETTIVAIFVALTWAGGYSDKPCEVYMLADGDLRTAEQLEPAPEPKRQPKAGEVWNGSGITEGPCVVMVPDTGALAGGVRVFHLGKSQQYWCNSEQFHRTCTYLAASLKDAAALGLL